MSTSDIPWDEIKAKLPFGRDEEAHGKRMELFALFDVNKNGYLSLAEADKGLRDVLRIEVFEAKPAIARAFHEAIKHARGPGVGPDFIKKKEFRLFLEFLNDYFELWVMFETIDPNMDRRISLEEFNAALPRLAHWGVTIQEEEAETVFAGIDSNDGGQVDFYEFCTWAISEKLKYSEVPIEEDICGEFDKYDLAGDGTISISELTGIFSELNPELSEPQMNEALELAKLGSDGIVSYREFVGWLFGKAGVAQVSA